MKGPKHADSELIPHNLSGFSYESDQNLANNSIEAKLDNIIANVKETNRLLRILVDIAEKKSDPNTNTFYNVI